MSRHNVRERPAWRVRIPSHTIQATSVGGSPRPGRYVLRERDDVRFEESSEAAIMASVRAAHLEAAVPPWLPYVRQTEQLASAQRCTWHPETASAG